MNEYSTNRNSLYIYLYNLKQSKTIDKPYEQVDNMTLPGWNMTGTEAPIDTQTGK